MKIEQIHFANINSLLGEWTVDLTDPAYLNSGIFLITGPTGAGKSTLLDALSLALYGRTPRIDSLSTSTNEIMSRQAASCFAEVIFSTAKGRFLACWSQKRTKRGQMPFQQPTHTLDAVIDTKRTTLTDKMRATADRIKVETGMDFEQFTRSMLLAQGAFAAFLQASSDKRAPILEQITGTQIYSQISIQCHEKLREEKSTLASLEQDLSAIHLLSPEELAAQSAEKQSLAKSHQASTSQSHQLATAIDTLEQLDKMTKQVQTFESQSLSLKQQLKDFAPQQTRLKRALEALELAPALLPLKQAREALRNQTEQIIPALHAKQSATDKRATKSRESLSALAAQMTTATQARTAAEKTKSATTAAKQALDGHRSTLLQGQTLAQLQARINDIDAALKASQDLANIDQEIRHSTTTIETLSNQLSQAEKLTQSTQNTANQAAALLEALEQKRLLSAQILDLSELRDKLRTGEACPLCGATDHPWAVQTPPPQLSTIEKELAQQKHALAQFNQDATAARQAETRLATLCDTQRQSLSEKTAKRTALATTVEAFPESYECYLAEKATLTETFRALDELDKKLLAANQSMALAESRHAQALKTEQDIHAQQAALLAEISALDGRIDELKREIKDASARQTTLSAEVDLCQTAFLKQVTGRGFTDEADYLAAHLSEADRKSLTQAAAKLNEAITHNQAQLTLSNQALQLLLQHPQPTETLDVLTLKRKDVETQIQAILQRQGAIEQIMTEDAQARALASSQLALIDKQRAVCAQWEALDHYIGSADGKVYRNFVQGLTFDYLITQANHELHKMSDRYLLIRHDPLSQGNPSRLAASQHLELNLIDAYQAGEVRSTKNLSGGESFIVSLALALALSNLSSQQASIDSLFLDEGFGTLDQALLETALATLATLNQTGKMIGIISHVPALKEAIPTQIGVVPAPNGHSSLTGPGITAH